MAYSGATLSDMPRMHASLPMMSRAFISTGPLLPMTAIKLVVRRARKAAAAGQKAQAGSPRAKSRRFRHFAEYRYSGNELKDMLGEAGFDVLETVPHDFYGSRDHAVGLVVDFRFLGKHNGHNFQLNWFGRLVSGALLRISPWVACASVLCVARCRKPQESS